MAMLTDGSGHEYETELFKDVYDNIVAFDLIYIIITLLSLIKCSKRDLF